MKNYVKPEINVVELSVKETMAALPDGISHSISSYSDATYSDVPLTVYDLTSLKTSQIQG